MKRVLLPLLLLLVPLTATAQTVPPDPIPMQVAATATGNGTSVSLAYYGGGTFEVTITGTATVTFKAYLTDIALAKAVSATNLATPGSSATTAAASGLYTVFAPGLRVIAAVTSYTSGTVTVTMRPVTAYLSKGGSGGAVTDVTGTIPIASTGGATPAISCPTCLTTADKDSTGGYVGLTLFKIDFKNVANTFTSFFTNSNSAARSYTFQNRDGTIADDTDLAGKQNSLGFTAENSANKVTAFSSPTDVQYPSAKLVSDQLALKQNSLGFTPLNAASNLSDVASAATARTNLGVAIGSNVQAWDGDLDAIAALSGTSGYAKKTAANTWTLDTSVFAPDSLAAHLAGTETFTGGKTHAVNLTISNDAPGIALTDTTSSAKSLTVAVDGNVADLRESAGASGSLFALDLANNRVGIGTAAPGARFHVFDSANHLQPKIEATGSGKVSSIQLVANSNNWEFGNYGSFLSPNNSFVFYFSGALKAYIDPAANGGLSVAANVTIGRHLIGNSTAPTIANGAGAGTSPGTPGLTGTDMAGQVTIITGTLPSVSAVAVTITFNVAYGTAPYVVIWPANAAAATLGFLPYVGSTTTTFTVNAGTVALGAATTYAYNYVVVQ